MSAVFSRPAHHQPFCPTEYPFWDPNLQQTATLRCEHVPVSALYPRRFSARKAGLLSIGSSDRRSEQKTRLPKPPGLCALD